jgi:hypothetical protein
MKSDNFWKYFWLTAGTMSLSCIAVSSTMFVRHISNVSAAAVGITFDANKDPFAFAAHENHFALTDGVLYRDALPLGLQQWNWDARLNWRAGEQVHGGVGALKIDFLKQWSGMGLSGFTAKHAAFKSLSLAVHPDSSVGDLYIEVYDAGNKALIRQSIGWYAEGGALVPNQWQVVTIPLDNLLTGSNTKAITGISISTTNPGVVYIDDIQFTAEAVSHPLWVQPQWVDVPPYNPFATSSPESLPYKIQFNQASFSDWHSYYGYFALTSNAFKVGPLAPEYSDSLIVFRGGRAWSDYSVSATVDWGITSTFSLLTRVSDSQNYASCAYSYYGQTVQIYIVKNGISTQMGQTPTLATKHEAAWEGMQAKVVVKGDTVSCYAGGEKVLSAKLPDMARAGTVGIEAWDKNQYASAHAIRSLEVRQLLGE